MVLVFRLDEHSQRLIDSAGSPKRPAPTSRDGWQDTPRPGCFLDGITRHAVIGPWRFAPGEVCRTRVADITAAAQPRKPAAE